MRIVRRAEFLALPEGTIYAKGEPWAFRSLAIKGPTFGNDWACLDPCWVSAQSSGDAVDRMEEMLATGASYPAESDFGRDGAFERDAVFMVFERDDLLMLRSFIDAALRLHDPRSPSS